MESIFKKNTYGNGVQKEWNNTSRDRQPLRRRDFLKRLTVTDIPKKLPVMIIYIILAVFVYANRENIRSASENIQYLSPAFEYIIKHIFEVYMIVGAVAVTALMIYPLGRKNAQEQFKRIGLINPCLIRKFRGKDNRSLTVWEFTTYGIPIQEWEKHQYYIETALDINIVKIRYRRGKSRIQLYTVPAREELPAQIQWKDKYLSKDSFVLTLGESHLGQVTVDLTKIPHILLGGSTGSGKSVLLKLILMQAIQKRARVYIADFKGGVDFTKGWQDKCDLCFDEERLIEILEMLTAVLEQRKAIFREAGCANLDEYNKTLKDAKLPRFILACDEAAEILDKTGLTKEQKEKVAKIESKLSMIARQGRAFGIHLILATQRPDATIIPGQIRNNIDCRICGRADNVLSQIILDNTAAAEQIPKDARGRFLLHDGTVFQAYWFDENTI